MCAWDRFCTFIREPQRRKVGSDAPISVNGIAYEVDPELAGQQVIMWWGIFDSELYVESGNERFGPYRPVGGPIPLNRYRASKRTAAEKRVDKVETLTIVQKKEGELGLFHRLNACGMYNLLYLWVIQKFGAH